MATKTSKGRELGYANYKSTGKYLKNRKARIMRAIARDPNNKELPIALNNIVYRRTKPLTRPWNHTLRSEAKLLREFKVALNTSNNIKKPVVVSDSYMLASKRAFSIEARISCKQESLP